MFFTYKLQLGRRDHTSGSLILGNPRTSAPPTPPPWVSVHFGRVLQFFVSPRHTDPLSIEILLPRNHGLRVWCVSTLLCRARLPQVQQISKGFQVRYIYIYIYIYILIYLLHGSYPYICTSWCSGVCAC